MSDQTLQSNQNIMMTNGHLRLRRCRHGMMLYNLNDIYVGTLLDTYGEFSEGEAALFRQMLQPGMTVVEIGANLGAHTLSLAHRVGPHGRVLAFEPQRAVFQILCANLALNGLEQVEPHWAAMGSAPGHITVPRLASTARQNFGGLQIGPMLNHRADQGDQIRLLTLDSFDLPACHLLKIDVEGMEADVIRGATDTIARLHPALYVENDRAEKSADLIALILGLEYRCYWHTPPLVTMPNYRGALEDKFPGIVSVNMICLPRAADIVMNGFREILSPQDTALPA